MIVRIEKEYNVPKPEEKDKQKTWRNPRIQQKS